MNGAPWTPAKMQTAAELPAGKAVGFASGMNVSDAVANALGDHVRSIRDEAIRAAARDGRKTVLDRDVPRSRR